MSLATRFFLICLSLFLVLAVQSEETQPQTGSSEDRASFLSLPEGVKGVFTDCVREICGTTDFQKIYRDANFDEKAQTREAEKEVTDAYKKFLNTRNMWLKNLEDYSKKVPLSINATRLAVITQVVENAVTYKDGSNLVEVDLSGKQISFKPTNSWDKEKPEVKNFFGKLSNVMINSKHMLANTYLQYGFTAPMAYRALNSKDSFQTAVRKDLQQAFAQVEILNRNFSENELKAIGISKKNLERFTKMKYFDETTGGVILKMTSKISLFSEMVRSKVIKEAADKLPPQELSKIIYLQENIDTIKTMKSIQENDLNLDSMDNQVIETCTSSFEQSIANLPMRAQVEIAKIKFEKLRSQFLNDLNKMFSYSTSEKLRAFLSRDKMPFFLPMSQEDFKSSFYAGLRSFKESQNVNQIVVTQYKDNAPLYFSKRVWNAAPFSLELKTFCDSLRFRTVRDHTSELGGIVVGAESIKDLEFGESVLIHELGHQVHHFLEDYSISGHSKIKFQEMVQCLNRMHGQELASHQERLKVATKDNELERKFLLNEKRYLGEDFSDMLSARGSKGNLGCKLVLAGQYSPEDLKNINELDVHSSAIFRLLHVYKIKGWPSNSSCNQAIEKVSTKEKFEDCLNKIGDSSRLNRIKKKK